MLIKAYLDHTKGCTGSDKAGGHTYWCYRDCKYGGHVCLFGFDPSDWIAGYSLQLGPSRKITWELFHHNNGHHEWCFFYGVYRFILFTFRHIQSSLRCLVLLVHQYPKTVGQLIITTNTRCLSFDLFTASAPYIQQGTYLSLHNPQKRQDKKENQLLQAFCRQHVYAIQFAFGICNWYSRDLCNSEWRDWKWRNVCQVGYHC